MEVQAGFIVGFDSDKPSIFQRQIDFIQKSGIVTAMVGLLTALPKTRLYNRLLETNRLVKEGSANNTKASALNFTPKMDLQVLLNGHKQILDTIYSPKFYYERIRTFLREFKPGKRQVPSTTPLSYKSFICINMDIGHQKKRAHLLLEIVFLEHFQTPKAFPLYHRTFNYRDSFQDGLIVLRVDKKN